MEWNTQVKRHIIYYTTNSQWHGVHPYTTVHWLFMLLLLAWRSCWTKHSVTSRLRQNDVHLTSLYCTNRVGFSVNEHRNHSCRYIKYTHSGTQSIFHKICTWFCWDLIAYGYIMGLGGFMWLPLLWRHNGRHSVSNHQPHDCLLNRLFRRRSKKTSKLRVTGLCVGNSPGTGEFPAQIASNAEMFSFDDVIMKPVDIWNAPKRCNGYAATLLPGNPSRTLSNVNVGRE